MGSRMGGRGEGRGAPCSTGARAFGRRGRLSPPSRTYMACTRPCISLLQPTLSHTLLHLRHHRHRPVQEAKEAEENRRLRAKEEGDVDCKQQ